MNPINKRTINRTALLSSLMLICAVFISCGQTKIEKLDKLIGAYVAEGQFNGSVLVSEKGKVIYKKGFGLANMEWNIPNQSDTKHRLGSITKQFTCMLIMQLVEQGKIKLNVPITTYLPDYPKKNGDIITIHHLMTHSSGTPNYTSFPGFFRDHGRDPYNASELVSYFADSTLDFKPGERFEYSNSGYALLGYIIEKVTGKSYEQLLQENILTPLKMVNTGYDHHNTILKNRASGYDKMGKRYANAGYLDMSIPHAAGGLYSTVEDLYLWDQALYTNQLLKKENMDLLFAKHMNAGDGTYYGYGWFIEDIPLGNTQEHLQTIGHGGGIHGFGTLITRIPSDKALIVLLDNTGGGPLETMTNAIAGILYDKSYDFPKKSVANSVADVMEKEGIDAALSHYKKVKDSPDYNLNEGEMNGVGYQFLQTGKAKEAAAIFKLNVEAFPKSFNVYDSYGEALLALGEKTESIVNYKKSLQLNPGSESGIKVLKELGEYSDTLIKKVPVEHLKLLEGDYVTTDGNWTIQFKEERGVLFGNDKGYRYKLVPIGDNEFVNPDDGASLVFDTKDKKEITLLLFGRKFKKVI
jgi:CubicO group peptidase (beta-lactamase class C family)